MGFQSVNYGVEVKLKLNTENKNYTKSRYFTLEIMAAKT